MAKIDAGEAEVLRLLLGATTREERTRTASIDRPTTSSGCLRYRAHPSIKSLSPPLPPTSTLPSPSQSQSLPIHLIHGRHQEQFYQRGERRRRDYDEGRFVEPSLSSTSLPSLASSLSPHSPTVPFVIIQRRSSLLWDTRRSCIEVGDFL